MYVPFNLWRGRRLFFLLGYILTVFSDCFLHDGKTCLELWLGNKTPESIKKKKQGNECVEFGLSSKRF